MTPEKRKKAMQTRELVDARLALKYGNARWKRLSALDIEFILEREYCDQCERTHLRRTEP